MINIYSVIGTDAPDPTGLPAANTNILRGHCRIVLQVHMQFPFSNCITFTVALFFSVYSTSCRIISVIAKIFTQVHDELVLEVDPSVVKEAAALLQKSMENAASLLGKYSAFTFFLFLHSKCLSQDL